MTESYVINLIEQLPKLNVEELKDLKKNFEHSLKVGTPHEREIEGILYHLNIILDIKVKG